MSPHRGTFESAEIVPRDKPDDELSSKNSLSLTAGPPELATGENVAMPV